MDRKWIGSDIDGVIFDTVPLYLKVINRLLGTEHKPEDLGCYKIEEALDLSTEVVDAAVVAALATGEYPLIPGARALGSICRFEGVFTLPVFITRRRQLFHRVTTEALRREFGPNFALHCHDGRPKSDIVTEYELDYFIEDGPQYAVDIAVSTNCKVYLLNNSYNQEIEWQYREMFNWAIHEGRIERVNNWLEIGVKICRDIRGVKDE